MANNARVEVRNGNVLEASRRLNRIMADDLAQLKRFLKRRKTNARSFSEARKKQRRKPYRPERLTDVSELLLRRTALEAELAQAGYFRAWTDQRKIQGDVPQGAGLIVKFLSDPPTFLVIQDSDRDLPGFIFGKKDPADETIMAAAAREAREEGFAGIEVALTITEENLVSYEHRNNYFRIFFWAAVPAETPVSPGADQVWARKETAEEIDRRIQGEKFFHGHTIFWLAFKNLNLHR
ncbi:MAG TPA: hypothetical protein VG941_02735 [Candidatus Paceibacterota bacterium]|nr:hypothetical protein [Candidatus Paceibacterota bacterium]